MQPLKGLTVVTLEHAIAALFATRQLADLGARVIKIERPGTGDLARGYDQRVRGLASHFVWTHRSKESLTRDVKHPLAAELLMQLMQLIVSKADCVVQNLAPGAAARLGVSWDALKAKRPDHGGDPRLDAVPALGAHTDAVLAELGVAPIEIAELRAAQVI